MRRRRGRRHQLLGEHLLFAALLLAVHRALVRRLTAPFRLVLALFGLPLAAVSGLGVELDEGLLALLLVLLDDHPGGGRRPPLQVLADGAEQRGAGSRRDEVGGALGQRGGHLWFLWGNGSGLHWQHKVLLLELGPEGLEVQCLHLARGQPNIHEQMKHGDLNHRLVFKPFE